MGEGSFKIRERQIFVDQQTFHLMKDGGMRGVFPSGCLVVIGLFMATYGAGRFSIDAALRANEVPRSPGSVRLKK